MLLFSEALVRNNTMNMQPRAIAYLVWLNLQTAQVLLTFHQLRATEIWKVKQHQKTQQSIHSIFLFSIKTTTNAYQGSKLQL